MPKNKKINKRNNKKTKKRNNKNIDVKGLGLLIIALIIVVFSALFITRLGQRKTTSTKITDQSESVVVAPENLLECQDEFYQKIENTYKVDATKYPKEDICQYYKTIKEDIEKNHNLQYNNEVIACRFFKENGETMIGETKYIHLGYEKKSCYQGMYR